MKLHGYLQSGILFIGDPVYMSGDSREGADNSQCNPFQSWDEFTHGLSGQDANLGFPGAFGDKPEGRGCAIQTGLVNGKYELEKHFDETGALSHIIIKVLP